MEKKYIVYKHTCKTTKKSYIGQTCQSTEKRWGNYGQCYLHHTKFYTDIVKYGWEDFEHEILEADLTREDAIKKENYYIDLYDTIENGYNAKYSAFKGRVGRPPVDRSMKFNRAFETTTALDNRLKQLANRKGMTLSAVIRDILEKFFEERSEL